MSKPKESFIHVGNIVNAATRKELTEYVKAVFKAGKETEQSGATIRHALSMFSECQGVKNISITDCNFTDGGSKS